MKPEEKNIVFEKGESIILKGRVFEIQKTYPNPDTYLILREADGLKEEEMKK